MGRGWGGDHGHQQCRRLGRLPRPRQHAEGGRSLAEALVHGIVGRGGGREEQRAQRALLLELVLDAPQHVVDEDAALQSGLAQRTLAVQLHQGDVEDGLPLQGVRYLGQAVRAEA